MTDRHYGGAVGYNYRIGKYEVTNAQWNAFTAAVGAPTGRTVVIAIVQLHRCSAANQLCKLV